MKAKKLLLMAVAAMFATATFAQKPMEVTAKEAPALNASTKASKVDPQAALTLKAAQSKLKAHKKANAPKKAIASIDDLVGTAMTVTEYYKVSGGSLVPVTPEDDQDPFTDGYVNEVTKVDDTTIGISYFDSNGASSVINATVDIAAGTVSIACDQVVWNHATYGDFIIKSAYGGDALEGVIDADGSIYITTPWYEAYNGGSSRNGYYKVTAIRPLNGTMTWASTTADVVIDQDPATKDVTVYNFGDQNTAVTINLKEDQSFSIEPQLCFYYNDTYGTFYWGDGASSSSNMLAITGTGTDNTLTFGNTWKLLSDKGYSIGGTRTAATITLNGGTFEYPTIPEVAATPANPSFVDFVRYISDTAKGSITFNVPTTDVDGNDIKGSLLSYEIFSDVNGTVTSVKKMDYTESDAEITSSVNTKTYTLEAVSNTYTRIGVKSIYTAAGETNESETVWFDMPQYARIPDGLEGKDYTFAGTKYSSGSNVDFSQDAKIYVDGDDIYITGVSTNLPTAAMKGTKTAEGEYTFKNRQIIGASTTTTLYFLGYDGSDFTDLVLKYKADEDYYEWQTDVIENGKAMQFYYYNWYNAGSHFGTWTIDELLDLFYEGRDLVNDGKNTYGVDELYNLLVEALGPLNDPWNSEKTANEDLIQRLKDAIEFVKKSNEQDPATETISEDATAQWVASEQATANEWVSGTTKGADLTTTIEGVTFTFDKADGSNDPAFYTTGAEPNVRVYKNNTLTLTGEGINSIEIEYTSYTGTGAGATTTWYPGVPQVTADGTAITLTHDDVNHKYTWTGDAASTIVIKNAPEDNAQLRIARMTVKRHNETVIDHTVNLTGALAADGKYYASYYNGTAPFIPEDNTVKVYTATVDEENDDLVLNEIEDQLISKATGVVLVADQADMKLIPGKKIERTYADNVLMGFDEETDVETGAYYGLAIKHETAGFYKINLTKVPANKAYMKAENAPKGKDFIPFAGDTTGIQAVENASEKADIYNLQGQRVNTAQKGVYIINGKKAVVK